jgi:hypothetical protein
MCPTRCDGFNERGGPVDRIGAFSAYMAAKVIATHADLRVGH